MIVLGGTFGAVLVTTPHGRSCCARSAGLGQIFFERASDTRGNHRASDPVRQPRRASRESSAWKPTLRPIEDPFLRKALSLAVDGTDLQELRKMMEIDIALAEQAAEDEAKVWEAAGGYAPTIGIIGAVMGLIQVMKHLEDIKEVGHGIAVAFVATVYGVGAANILFLPAASKLRTRMHQASLRKDMMLEGVIGHRRRAESDADPHEAGCVPSGGARVRRRRPAKPPGAVKKEGPTHEAPTKSGQRTRITNAGWSPMPIS